MPNLGLTSTSTWQTQIDTWYPTNRLFNSTDVWSSILADCDALVHKAVNASGPPLASFTQACDFYQLAGTRFKGGVIYQGYNAMVCTSATAINIVSAKLEIDNDRIKGQVFSLGLKRPSPTLTAEERIHLRFSMGEPLLMHEVRLTDIEGRSKTIKSKR